MRSIEHKLDILTNNMAGSVPDKEAQQYTYPYNTVVNGWNNKSTTDSHRVFWLRFGLVYC